jgi:hypothetical protein
MNTIQFEGIHVNSIQSNMHTDTQKINLKLRIDNASFFAGETQAMSKQRLDVN